MQPGERKRLGEIGLAVGATFGPTCVHLDDDRAVESTGGEGLQQLRAWLVAATGNEMLVARSTDAVSDVHVRQSSIHLARHVHRVRL